MFLLDVPSAWEAEVEEGAGDEEGEVAQRGGDAELGGDEAAEAAAFQGLAVEDVDVVEGVGGEAEQERGGDERAEARGARQQKEDGGDEFGGDDGKGRGPDPALCDEVREVGGEVGEREELSAYREEEERREAEAADVDENPE